MTGNDLLEACQTEALEAYCSAFIIGTWEGIVLGTSLVLYATSDTPPKTAEVNRFWQLILRVCPPAEGTNQQLQDVIIKYLVEHPADRHQTARILIHDGMMDAFPCSTDDD